MPPKAQPLMREVSVNGTAIVEADILAEAQLHPAKNPGEALKAASIALVIRALLLQEANRLEVVADPEEDDEGNIECQDDANIRALIGQEAKAPQSSDEECRRYFENNRERFCSDTIYEARHILLPVSQGDPTSEEKVRAQAKDMIAHLSKKPSDFSSMAKEFSACSSKEHGGNLGQITRGSTVSEFERVVEQMTPGELWPDPVDSRFGFHIVLLDHMVPGETLPFDYVKDRIAAWLEAASWSRAVSQYIGVLAGEATICGVTLDAADGPLVQ
ncbi:MAG: peptidylprolyl isomerase [Parvibaculaceae bacterium]|nr:peptidylprolyl isomerase [Parvibaculaceae bacterium]